jgi:GNAT superfamily N-acetyltransferase
MKNPTLPAKLVRAMPYTPVNKHPPPRSRPSTSVLAPTRHSAGVRNRKIVTRDGTTLQLRAIRTSDVLALQRGFNRLTPDEVRSRFLHPMTGLTDEYALHLCDVDADYAVVLVLIDPEGTPEQEIRAVARAHIDPATLSAEFALIVQKQFSGQGLGDLLMRRLIAECRKHDAIELWGDVLVDNGAMLELCESLGFQRHAQAHDDPGLMRVTLAI